MFQFFLSKCYKKKTLDIKENQVFVDFEVRIRKEPRVLRGVPPKLKKGFFVISIHQESQKKTEFSKLQESRLYIK